MALHDRLMLNLRAHLPGALDSMIQLELWNILQDFCKNTHAWQQNISIDLEAGELIYPASEFTPDDAYILGLVSAEHPTYDVTGAYFANDELVLYERRPPAAADEDAQLVARFALAPSLEAGGDIETMIPADMWSAYHQQFLDGVLALMMAQAAKPYSNPSMAQIHARAYKSGTAVARWRVKSYNVPGAQLWRYPTHTR